MKKEDVKREIKKLINSNSVQFREQSDIEATASNVTILNVNEINADNPDFENIQFSGIADITISDHEGGEITIPQKRIEGEAKKVGKTVITISKPIKVCK